MTLIRGVRIGSYEIVSAVGRGGAGEVYLAKDLEVHRDVAVKLMGEELASNPERLARLEYEARAASALNHPNIITIHDIGVHNSRPFIVMEYVGGRSLRDLLSGEPLPPEKILSVATQTADGLARAHASGLVHGDLKPENLMVTEDERLKILDFGLAAMIPETHAPEADPNTNGYLSPEQAAGSQADYQSDQFALGTILYEMATGEHPFRRETTAETLAAIRESEPRSIADVNPDVPEDLPTVVERCLSKSPENRYASTGDLARDLARIHTGPFAELIAALKRRFGLS